MTATLFQGPLVTVGNALDSINGTEQKTGPDAGPNISYKGDSFLDVRFAPVNKERAGMPGIIPAFYTTQVQRVVNAVPSTLGASGNISAAANTTSGTAVTLAAAGTGIATGIPFLQYGTSTVITANMALDMGIDSANCTSGSKTITVADSTIYKVGQPLCIANVGNSGGTTALLTWVTALASATTITVNDAAQATNSATPIDTALPGWGNLCNMAPSYPLYAAPYVEGGVGLFYDSRRIFSRGISITGVSGGAGGNFTVVGYDGWGQPQTEVITVAAGVNTVKSVKTYKYLTSITPTFTDAHNYSVNTADLFGFPLFSKYFEELLVYMAGSLITANTGWTAGDTTSPATTTTKDVRGTYALQTASNGTRRLVIYQLPSFQEVVGASPSNPTSLYGVTPV